MKWLRNVSVPWDADGKAFPTYLGLPLSCTKLRIRISTFDPHIARADRFLAGWQSFLLNPMGRTVLVNSVLDSQMIYLLCALQLPPGAIAQFDQKKTRLPLGWRERCFWCGMPGGMGQGSAQPRTRWSRDEEHQTSELLPALLHRLHHPQGSSWATWIRDNACVASLEGNLTGHHWAALRELLPLYRAITTVQLGDGKGKRRLSGLMCGSEMTVSRTSSWL